MLAHASEEENFTNALAFLVEHELLPTAGADEQQPEPYSQAVAGSSAAAVASIVALDEMAARFDRAQRRRRGSIIRFGGADARGESSRRVCGSWPHA